MLQLLVLLLKLNSFSYLFEREPRKLNPYYASLYAMRFNLMEFLSDGIFFFHGLQPWHFLLLLLFGPHLALNV
jgi:hypothetical protein